jgi:3-oxoacyl-[acyl-carrier-protein] synthase II
MKLAITGVGLVSPLGNTIEENLTNLKNMEIPIQDARIMEDSIASHLMKCNKIFHCNYDNVDLSQLLDKKEVRYSDPICKTSMIAVDEAIKQSGIDLPDYTSVNIGSIQGGCLSEVQWVEKLITGRDKIHPKSLLNSAHEYVSNIIAEHYGLHGPCSVTAATCISGVQALQYAQHAIMAGDECAIVGATDFMTTSTTLYYFQMLGAFSDSGKSTPFDKNRDGIIMGEGSAYLVVEPLDKAIERNAPIRWIVDGLGIASDAHHPTQPDPSGTGGKIAIAQAMNQAGTTTEDYEIFNLHATGTPVGDPIEIDVLKGYFNSGTLYSNKGQIGHMMGASGLAEVILGAEAMTQGWIPGNGGLVEPLGDEHFDFTFGPEERNYNRFLKTSFGFGGRSAAMSVCKYEG